MSFFDSTVEWVFLVLGLTGLHLVWQTAMAAAAAAAVTRWGSALPAATRYRLAFLLLGSIPVVAIGTGVAIAGGGIGPEPDGVGTAGVALPNQPLLAAIAPWIGLVWVAGMGAGLVRWAGGLWWTTRFRAQGSERPDGWSRATARIGRRFGLTRRVELQSSPHVSVPSVIGVATPRIVVPATWRSMLNRADREAVLAHELAHVQRRDPLANAVQRLIVAFLFFHPGARWLSRVIDREREFVCDELAIRQGVSRRRYARALGRLALSTAHTPRATLSFNTSDVAARIRRLTDRSHPPERTGTGWLTSAALAGTWGGLLVITAALVPFTHRVAATAPAWETRVLAAAPPSFYTVDAVDPRGAFTVSVRNGAVVAAAIEGVPMPRAHIRQRGARVTLQGPTPTETFVVRVRAAGGIDWSARPARPSTLPN